MTAKPGFIEKWLPSPKMWVGITAMSLPVAYIVKKHMDWKPRPDSKKRMLIHHMVFWSAGVPALKFLHKAWGEFDKEKKFLLKEGGSGIKAAGWLAAAAGTLIGAFEGGERLAKALIPKPPKPMVSGPSGAFLPGSPITPTTPQPVTTTRPVSASAFQPIPPSYSPSFYRAGVSLR